MNNTPFFEEGKCYRYICPNESKSEGIYKAMWVRRTTWTYPVVIRVMFLGVKSNAVMIRSFATDLDDMDNRNGYFLLC